mmetsp:Transcript_48745/g.153018  ORF Transcript_48745/g.153018 Transcript_48745/m.153018 type:complete len:218 (-) Transcript_48745:2-655(-)
MGSVHTILTRGSSNTSWAFWSDHTRNLGDSVIDVLGLRIDGSENLSGLSLDISSQISHASIDSVRSLLRSLERPLQPSLFLLLLLLLLLLFSQVLLLLLLLVCRRVAHRVLAARKLHNNAVRGGLGSTRGGIHCSSYHIAGKLGELGLIRKGQLLRGNSVVSLLVKSTATSGIRFLGYQQNKGNCEGCHKDRCTNYQDAPLHGAVPHEPPRGCQETA